MRNVRSRGVTTVRRSTDTFKARISRTRWLSASCIPLNSYDVLDVFLCITAKKIFTLGCNISCFKHQKEIVNLIRTDHISKLLDCNFKIHF